jgi:hypothetical protein
MLSANGTPKIPGDMFTVKWLVWLLLGIALSCSYFVTMQDKILMLDSMISICNVGLLTFLIAFVAVLPEFLPPGG